MRTDRNKLGMWLFIAQEVVFFAGLILAYVYYRAAAHTGAQAAHALDPAKTGIYTILLLASSATLWMAERAVKQARRRRVCGWLLATVVLGAAFLVGQGMEYNRLFQKEVTVSQSLFGTTFFTLTGFHGLHVLGGVITLAILTGLALSGSFKGPRAPAVEATAIYWHFVDAVWIVIFAVVYLWTL